MLAMRGLEQGDAPHCARRRVSEANRRVAAALRPEMRRNQQSSGLLVRQRVLYFSRTICYGITVHGLPTIFIYYKLLLCQLHHQFGFGGGDGKLEFILQVRLLQHIDDVVLHGGWLDAEFFCNLVIG